MSSLISTTLLIHGYWRWVILVLAIIAAVKFAMGWFGKGKVQEFDKQIASWFAIAMTIQLVLGIINLIGYISMGGFNARIHMEHTVYGLIATGLSHAIPMRKEMRPDVARFPDGVYLRGGVSHRRNGQRDPVARRLELVTMTNDNRPSATAQCQWRGAVINLAKIRS